MTDQFVTSLSWSDYQELLSLKDANEISYYINQVIKYKWSKRKIRVHIKNKKQDNTIGIIVSKKDDKYLIEYSSDSRIKVTLYELV